MFNRKLPTIQVEVKMGPDGRCPRAGCSDKRLVKLFEREAQKAAKREGK